MAMLTQNIILIISIFLCLSTTGLLFAIYKIFKISKLLKESIKDVAFNILRREIAKNERRGIKVDLAPLQKATDAVLPGVIWLNSINKESIDSIDPEPTSTRDFSAANCCSVCTSQRRSGHE